MANKISQRTPLTVVGPLLPEVKFNIELYIAEADLTNEVTLTPISQVGTPESLKPIIGAKVIYKFTNAGPAANLVIGPGFNLDPQSVLFDPAPGAVNVVTMFYDGTEFWANLSTANPTPVPLPAGGSITRIGDFGWGPDIIVVNTQPCQTGILVMEGGPLTRVSAFDLITSIHYLGTDTLVFTLDDYSNPGTPVSDTDPKLAYREFDCTQIGVQVVGVTVSELEGALVSQQVQVYVQVDDQTPSVCGN